MCFYPVNKEAMSDCSNTDPKSEFKAATRWAWISLMIEVKTQHGDCPFAFDNKDNESRKSNSSVEPGSAAREQADGPEVSRESTSGSSSLLAGGRRPTLFRSSKITRHFGMLPPK